MAIPDYESLMLPLLQCLGRCEEVAFAEVVDELAKHFGLSEEEQEQLLPSGRYPVFRSRVGWARMYLKHAALLTAPRRGYMRITPRGTALLAESPTSIDNRLLERFPEFKEFRRRSAAGDAPGQTPGQLAPLHDGASAEPRLSPEEQMETAFQTLGLTLRTDLASQIMACSPAFFEELVVQLLLKMGYGGSRKEAGKAVGRTGDGGIDGVIAEDRLGLDSIYVQAKRWTGSVGEPDIRNFLGALVGRGASKGVFITTSSFSEPARSFAARSIQQKLVLIDGERLAELMIEHDLGVSTVATYQIKRLDSDFFVDE